MSEQFAMFAKIGVVIPWDGRHDINVESQKDYDDPTIVTIEDVDQPGDIYLLRLVTPDDASTGDEMQGPFSTHAEAYAARTSTDPWERVTTVTR